MSSNASRTVNWAIDMRFDEDVDHTNAVAILSLPSGREVRGDGQAKRNPMDRPSPRIGEEVAAARALSKLAHELLEYAASEIERNVHPSAPR